MKLNEYPEPSWIGEAPNEPRSQEIARCPTCSMHFLEKDGVDVEQGEVCCCGECALQFETL